MKITKRTAMAALATLSFVVVSHANARRATGSVLLGSTNVNTATEGELRRIPGLRRNDVRRILIERRQAAFHCPEDLYFIDSPVALRYLHFEGPSDLRTIRHAPAALLKRTA